GPLQRGAQILERNTRRVGRKDRTGLHPWLEPSVDLLLQLELFGDGLDDEVGVAHALARHIRHQPVERVAYLDRLAGDLCEELGGALDRARERLRPPVGRGDAQALLTAPG